MPAKKKYHTLALEPACSFMVLFPELHDMECSPGVAVLSLLIHIGLHPSLTVHNLRALFFLSTGAVLTALAGCPLSQALGYVDGERSGAHLLQL